MLREHASSARSLLMSVDVALSGAVLMLMLSFPFATGVHSGEAWQLTPSILAVALCACLVWPYCLDALGLYGSLRRLEPDEVIGRLSVAGCASTLLIAATAYVAGAPLSPKFSLLFGAAQFSILTTERFVLLGVLRLARRAGRNTRDILIVGSGPRALMITRTIQANPSWGLRVVGYLDSGDAPHSPGIPAEAMRKMVDVRAILRERVIDEVMIAVPRSMFGEVGPVVAACGEAGVPFTLLSDVFGDYLPPPVVTRFGPLASLRFAAVHHSATLIALKRGIDVLGGALGLVVSIPVLLPAAIAIRLDSRGPIFFRQKRCGLYGRAFDLYKLRTMVVDAEDRKQDLLHLNEMSGPVFKIKNDPRVTTVGRWLRRFSIDELPQFWNVLRGDMSLVGPRPALPGEVSHYQTFERRRLSMRPGLTCLWQVSGRSKVRNFEEWVQMDLAYIDRWSLGLDVQILARTVMAVLRATGE